MRWSYILKNNFSQSTVYVRKLPSCADSNCINVSCAPKSWSNLNVLQIEMMATNRKTQHIRLQQRQLRIARDTRWCEGILYRACALSRWSDMLPVAGDVTRRARRLIIALIKTQVNISYNYCAKLKQQLKRNLFLRCPNELMLSTQQTQITSETQNGRTWWYNHTRIQYMMVISLLVWRQFVDSGNRPGTYPSLSSALSTKRKQPKQISQTGSCAQNG